MHLRRIELQGFKTFSRRTVVELPQGVTAVVGPNGSGKSNLADAIRWALGEQTLRTLRVRRSDEMIFGGTATRPRTGMAEVLLVFDNADAWLPTPYAEVVIGRDFDGQHPGLAGVPDPSRASVAAPPPPDWRHQQSQQQQ